MRVIVVTKYSIAAVLFPLYAHGAQKCVSSSFCDDTHDSLVSGQLFRRSFITPTHSGQSPVGGGGDGEAVASRGEPHMSVTERSAALREEKKLRSAGTARVPTWRGRRTPRAAGGGGGREAHATRIRHDRGKPPSFWCESLVQPVCEYERGGCRDLVPTQFLGLELALYF